MREFPNEKAKKDYLDFQAALHAVFNKNMAHICVVAKEFGFDPDIVLESYFNYVLHSMQRIKTLHNFEAPEQTQKERIGLMGYEELAKFLAGFRVQDIMNKWCMELCPCMKIDDCDCPYGEYETILLWLRTMVADL